MSFKENIFFSNFNKLKCFENKPHVAVGVSGGPDSMALVYVVNKWINLNKGKLSALVFDHKLRKNSEEESYQVKEMLKNYNIEAVIIKAKKNKLLKRNMAQARVNRFEGLIDYCYKNHILHLFLGHHFDDNLETYLIRKINGSNMEGLGSMNEITYFNNIQILRPFIKKDKISILKFNKKNKIKFIHDPTNQDTNYTRVKVRNFLKNQNYKKSALIDFISLKKQIPYYKKMIWELLVRSLIEVQSNRIKISFDKLNKLDNLIIEKHILILLKFFSNNKYQVKSSKINLFIGLMKKSSFKIFNLSGIIIIKSADLLIFSQK